MVRVGTHAVAMDRSQVEELVDRFKEALNTPGVETLLLVMSDDDEVQLWFDSIGVGEVTGDEPVPTPVMDSIFTGRVWTLGVGLKITDTLERLGMEVTQDG